jgi:hypothetical protein
MEYMNALQLLDRQKADAWKPLAILCSGMAPAAPEVFLAFPFGMAFVVPEIVHFFSDLLAFVLFFPCSHIAFLTRTVPLSCSILGWCRRTGTRPSGPHDGGWSMDVNAGAPRLAGRQRGGHTKGESGAAGEEHVEASPI